MEKKQNPNFHKRLTRRRQTSNSWSELPLDLLVSVFQRLCFANFHRAKSVCSSWYSASKQSMPKDHSPWLILFPEDNNNNKSCMFFNPEEKYKLYKTQDLGLEFAKSVCEATYGSWLLMRDPVYNLYIMNLLTCEKIHLPSMDSQLGMVKVEEKPYWGVPTMFYINGQTSMYVASPVFWIDEKTKDYIVLWGLEFYCVVYAKNGDTSWNQIQEEASDCLDMVYKDHKLYFLSLYGSFKIFDFSGGFAHKTFQCGVEVERYDLGREPRLVCTPRSSVDTTLVVTLTGKVLEVEKRWRESSRAWSFRIFNIYSSGFLKKPKLVKSLGDETILLDQGITLLANDAEGFIKNSIYFGDCPEKKKTTELFVYNLKTHKTESLRKFVSSSIQLYKARWLFPSFTNTL